MPEQDTEHYNESVDQAEILEDQAALFRNPDYVSVVLRRHTDYTREPEKRGFLNPQGYNLAKESAREVVTLLPSGAEVQLTYSPSFMPARDRGLIKSDQVLDPAQVGEKIQPARAQFTARVYGKELHEEGYLASEPRVSIDKAGLLEMAGVNKDTRLGDFLETATSAEGVANFYKVNNSPEGYNGLTTEFWRDYARGTLKPAVAEAIRAAGGADSLQLAQNLTTVLSEQGDKERDGRKHAAIDITHGESIEALLHYVETFLQSDGQNETVEALRAVSEAGINYNQGMEVHIGGAGETVLVAHDYKHDGRPIRITMQLDAFNQYLNQQRHEQGAA